jgi:HAD superfamily hydrolase (TIGR01549 family)
MPVNGNRSSDPAMLFDLDGTLVDTNYLHVLAWSETLKEAGLRVPEWKIHRRIGMSGQSLIRQLMREHGRHSRIDPKQLEKKHDANFQKFSRAKDSILPLPGAEALLRHLSRLGIRWAVATTGTKEQTTRLIRRLRIPSSTVIITGDDVEKAKPSPDVFEAAANRLGVPLDHCIVVGDSIWDMLAAGRRHALSVGLLCGGYSQTELEQAGAFRVYADAEDMRHHIEDLGIS